MFGMKLASHAGTRKWLLTTAGALAGILTLGAPQSARADLEIALSEDAGVRVVVGTAASFTSVAFTGVFNDFSVQIFGGASSNGATLSSLLSSTTSVQNNSGAAHTLHLWVTQTDYTLPAALTGLNVQSGLGGSVNVPTLTLAGIFQAWADKNNGLFGIADFTNGVQNAVANGGTFDTGSAFGTFTRLATPFSVTSEANFGLTGGGQANYSDHVNLTAIPEPSTLLLFGTTLLGLGLLYRRRLHLS
jgi:PEP-CTERM motif-containing protein